MKCKVLRDSNVWGQSLAQEQYFYTLMVELLPLEKAPAVEAEHEENPAQGKWQEAHHAGNQDSEKWTQQKAHMTQSHIREDLWLR